MTNYRHTLIAREGWLFLFLIMVAGIVSYTTLGYIAALPFILIWLVLLFLFRDPPRKIPAAPLALVSPVDGTIINIETIHDDFLDREAICFTIKMHWYGIYTTRSPMEGKVLDQWFVDGKQGPVEQKQRQNPAKRRSRGYAQWIQSDEADDIVVSMQADKMSRKPGCLVITGERLGQGQRCGLIHFGETVRIYAPVNTQLEKQQGDKVLAGSDIIATLVH